MTTKAQTNSTGFLEVAVCFLCFSLQFWRPSKSVSFWSTRKALSTPNSCGGSRGKSLVRPFFWLVVSVTSVIYCNQVKQNGGFGLQQRVDGLKKYPCRNGMSLKNRRDNTNQHRNHMWIWGCLLSAKNYMRNHRSIPHLKINITWEYHHFQ